MTDAKGVWLGPDAPPGSTCAVCGRPAPLECQGCKACYCLPDWWRHSHTDVAMQERERAAKAKAVRP